MPETDGVLSLGANTKPLDDALAKSAGVAEKYEQRVVDAATSAEKALEKSAKNMAASANKVDRILERKTQIIGKRQEADLARTQGFRQLSSDKTQDAKDLATHRTNERIRADVSIAENRRARQIIRRENEFAAKYEAQTRDPWRQLNAASRSTGMGASATYFGQVNSYYARQNMLSQMQAGLAANGPGGGVGVWQQALNASIARSNAAYANTAFAPTPPAPPTRGGGRGGGGWGLAGRLIGAGGGGAMGSVVSSLAGGFGIGLGGYALARGMEAAKDAEALATAYDRQEVAARELAGSQAKLNELLATYQDASGGAIDRATALQNVSRLLATGFAETTAEVDRFVRATRGAALATGKPQDYIVQETQLAISNTSFKRLDQIGLGIEEVTTRIEELRAANSGMTREMAFQQAVLTLMDEKYSKLSKSAEGAATQMEKLGTFAKNTGLEVSQAAQGPINQMAAALALLGKAGVEWFKAMRKELDFYIQGLRMLGMVQLPGALGGGFMLTVEEQRAIREGDVRHSARRGRGGAERGRPATISEEERSIRNQHYESVLALDKQHNQQLLDENRQYHQNRLSAERNFQKGMAREEEDFARQRARALEDYELSILQVMREAQDREAELQEDLDERLADLREDGNEKLSDLEEKYNKDREKALKDHRERLLKAAANLDAVAVYEEQRRFRIEQKERDEQHKEQVDEVRESLQEQIEEAQEAHREQLEDARKADEKRLQDMAAARELQLRRENEDREIQKARAIEDHNEQLAEMDRVHAETITRINKQAEEERIALREALEKSLYEAEIYVAGLTQKYKAREKMIDDWWDAFILRMEKEIKKERESTYRYDPKTGPNIPQDYGKALLNPAPAVVSSSVTTSSATVTRNGNTLNLAAGAITVNAAQDPEETGRIVYQKIIDLANVGDGGIYR